MTYTFQPYVPNLHSCFGGVLLCRLWWGPSRDEWYSEVPVPSGWQGKKPRALKYVYLTLQTGLGKNGLPVYQPFGCYRTEPVRGVVPNVVYIPQGAIAEVYVKHGISRQ